MVGGTLEKRSWEKDGRKYQTVEVVVEKFDFLESKKQESGGFEPIHEPDAMLPF